MAQNAPLTTAIRWIWSGSTSMAVIQINGNFYFFPMSLKNVKIPFFRLPKDSEYLSDDGEASNYSVLSNKSTKNRENLIRRVDQNLKVNTHVPVARSGNSSRRSTPDPDSMEWDLDHNLKSEVDSVDFETKELLNEIEQLKNRVLSETGEGILVQLEKAEVYES